MTDHSLTDFFYPSSICIAGASTKEKSIGFELLNTLINYGYKGNIYPVNPKAEKILTLTCYKNIDELPGKISLGIIVVPKLYAEETIDAMIRKGVKSLILVTAGFKEANAEGAAIEQRIVNKIKHAGGRLLGPNCMGVINTFDTVKLNATFVAEKPETGHTAFLSQSGALGAAILNSLRETGIKLGHFISVGNKADISENDLLGFWQNDKKIKTITMYLEDFVNGVSFLKPFIKKEITKPVIVLKAGRTTGGMKAALSHTGALGSNDKVINAVLNQFGIIRVENLNDLFNTAKGFEYFPLPKGKNIAVVTNAGGPAILTVDAFEKEGLKLAALSDSTKIKLRDIAHPEGSVENPVDLLPGGLANQFTAAVEILLQDNNVDAIISIFVEPVMVNPFNVVEGINNIFCDKPVLQVVMPLPEFWDRYRKNSATIRPVFKNPEDPVKVLSNLFSFANRNNSYTYLDEGSLEIKIKEERCFLPQTSIIKLARHYNIPLIRSQIIKANLINTELDHSNFPVVLKGFAQNVVHKSELNAVKLNIKNKEELLSAAQEILNSFNEKNMELEEFVVQPYIKASHEILIGGFRDPSFGAVIMFGSGGKYVEVFNDIAIKSAYISDEDIVEMVSSTNIGKILKGVRGELPVDLMEVYGLIKSSAQMMLDNPRISEFDFNPILLTKHSNLYAVDIRIKVD